jgi:alanyl aminopeptidase
MRAFAHAKALMFACRSLVFAALVTALVTFAHFATAASLIPPALRLPDGARPTHYALTLTIVPGEPKAAGEITIDVELDRPHDVLWLNADRLDIKGASADDGALQATVAATADQFVAFAFDPPLSAGKHRLVVRYEAEQDRHSSRGIFTLEDGGARYSMTQFEATSARKAFPCFDEPGFKVPWQLTLRMPRGSIALSNTGVTSTLDEPDGLTRVVFAETKPLPSYLVAFAVGPFDVVDAGVVANTPVRVVGPRGSAAKLAFARRALPELFALEQRWFGIPYRYGKLDHVAIPLTVSFAMENAGLITYGAPILLPNGEASARYRHTLASVAAHEIAHQWFGDLVTMRWWDDVWLNEAFATWFAAKTVDVWQPGYEKGASRARARAEAIEADALPSARRIRQPIVTRGDIYNAFDAITYEKGATVLGMFEGWLGEDAFRQGVRDYVDRHRDGNAGVDDFLAALSGATTRSSVAPAFRTFLDQSGAPRVGVAMQCQAGGRATLTLRQQPLAPAGTARGEKRWQVPVCVRYGRAATTREACTLLASTSVTLPLEGGCPSFVFANAGGRGYYVADYAGDRLARLFARPGALTPLEQASLIYDLRPLLRAGAIDVARVLGGVRAGARSRERAVMQAAIDVAAFVRDELVDAPERDAFAKFVRQNFAARARALGFVPRRGESDDDALLRRELLRVVGADDPSLSMKARRLARQWLADRRAVDPGVVDTVLWIAAQSGDAALLEAMQRQALATIDRDERRSLLIALMSFRDPALVQRGLALLLDPRIDIREATSALRVAGGMPATSRAIHAFVVAHFEALAARVDRDTPAGWPEYASAFCGGDDRRDVEAFWQPRIAHYPGGEHNLAEALESIDLCTGLRARERAVLDRYLGVRG